MANLRDIRTRIAGVKKTRQITSAMKLVAGAKLRRATERAVSARPYQQKLTEVLARVARKAGDSFQHPLLERREQVKTLHVTILTSDKGLCGPFNSTLLRQTHVWLKDKQAEGFEIKLRVYGRKGRDFFVNRKYEVDGIVAYDKIPKIELIRDLGTEVLGGYSEGRWDESWLVYNEFVNTMVQKPKFFRIAPLVLPQAAGDEALLDHRYEPAPEELLTRLLPLYLRTVALQAFLETEAGEHAARMTAMDNATRNAGDIIDNLSLQYNRARQAAITTEIIEIVAGAEAL